MSRYNRYRMLKKFYGGYCVMLVSGDGFVSCGIDKDIIGVLTNDISYIVVDGLSIIKVYDAADNRYYKCFYYYGIKKILSKF